MGRPSAASLGTRDKRRIFGRHLGRYLDRARAVPIVGGEHALAFLEARP